VLATIPTTIALIIVYKKPVGVAYVKSKVITIPITKNAIEIKITKKKNSQKIVTQTGESFPKTHLKYSFIALTLSLPELHLATLQHPLGTQDILLLAQTQILRKNR
jgi:hypothetical protein